MDLINKLNSLEVLFLEKHDSTVYFNRTDAVAPSLAERLRKSA